MRLSGRKASRFTRSWAPPQRIVLFSLLGLNAIAFIIQVVLNSWNRGFVLEYLGLSDRGISDAYALQFFTAPLLYHNIWHFLAIMLVLYFVGRDVEAIIGQRQFLFLYLFGAFSGELGHLFLMPSNCALFAGSGGVTAIFVAYATILPELEMTTLLLFMVPVRLKMRRLAQIALVGAVALLLFDRSGPVGHSAFVGGAVAGWFYAHLLGFGRTSFLQHILRQRRLEAARLQSMSADQFVAEEIDPLLVKISQRGLASLSRPERRLREQTSEKMLSENAG